MKKNVMMRVAAILLVCVLASTCGISGTFAKYVTEKATQDTARVAHWGVNIVGTADVFDTEYAKEDGAYTLTANSVITNNGDKLVAPGTAGSIADIDLTGIPEVAARITYTVTNIEFDNWLVDTNADDTGDYFYCPLVFTIGANEVKGLDYLDDMSGLITAIESLVAATYDVAPNVGLSGAESLTIEWRWDFEQASNIALYNKYDTFLGDQAAAGNAATVTIEVTCTITQIN